MREDELAADAMGINIVRTKLMAFAMGATFSGFAGAFYGAAGLWQWRLHATSQGTSPTSSPRAPAGARRWTSRARPTSGWCAGSTT